MSYKINNVYYSPYVYRFCSQICSQNFFAILKEELTTIKKIHMCSFINWALCFSSFDVTFIISRFLGTDLFDGYVLSTAGIFYTSIADF